MALVLYACYLGHGTVAPTVYAEQYSYQHWQNPDTRGSARKEQRPAMTSILYKIETQEEEDALLANALAVADTTVEELRRQGQLGRFVSEKHRRVWFTVHGLGYI